ncbi:G-protein beta WD-40 repeats containing protein [Reticulomyxa filosa]|uniref:G-protein beta WD-40 repeats containing protein n=1 Tax=Reticulomyxa filosa TaxID=46433 RepID=X6M0L9_RETFI|nr:G-protein beta WD-40 repeats containing protein [Reticulomyxa filosa]|eukprot:ETO07394.1 G-protein beta WD-40 repeats containing protein [Reticulomyxa filosa]
MFIIFTKEGISIFAYKDEKKVSSLDNKKEKLLGGMQPVVEQGRYEMEMKMLKRVGGNLVKEEEWGKHLEESNGDVSIVIEKMVSTLMLQKTKNEQEMETSKEMEPKLDQLKKDDEKVEIGETKPGINLQGYCINQDCLAAKAKLPVWVNIGFGDTSFYSDKTRYCCPDCRQPTVTSVVKVLFFNSEHSITSSDNSIPVKDNYYQCFYVIQPKLFYELKSNKIRQHTINLDDLITRSEDAMTSNEILNLVAELQKYLITVVKPSKVKDKTRLLEKIQYDYNGDYNQVFDVGRFTILCDNPTKLQTAVAVVKKAEKFNLIVSEDKDFFERQSKTHHRFHNIKLYVPKHDVYVEMQATLKHFTTLEGYTVIENPKLSHLFYEHIRAWKPNNPNEEDLKQASDETLTKINDIICEWIDGKAIQKIANRYKSSSEIGILKPSQLSKKSHEEINKDAMLKMSQFVYEQLCKFTPEKTKGKAIYVILYEYYKKYVVGNKNPASCADFALILQEARIQEMEGDVTISQALDMYVSLQANSYPYVDDTDNEKDDSYDCHRHVIEFLGKEGGEEKYHEQQKRKVMVIQGKSGSGKSLFCRYLEETLWNNYNSNLKQSIPVYISFAKIYNKNNEKDIILQTLQGKRINKEIMDVIREKASFVFIMDGFDEIFDKYNKTDDNNKYFYDHFNLNQWNAKVIVTCRSKVLNEEDITSALIGINKNNTSMMYLWPFTKQQMHSYIEKFVTMTFKKNNNNSNWTAKKYEETLNNYPNLQKMVEEPFLLQLILTVLPLLVKQYGIGSRISKAQIYDVFNDQWIDIHIQQLISKLTELRIQMNSNKTKSTFEQYCLDLGFDSFIHGNQVAIESDSQYENNEDEIWCKVDPETESDFMNEKKEAIAINEIINTSIEKTQDVWKKYFNDDNLAKYVLRRVGDNKYQFLHKSCQEYYAAQKIIFDVIPWQPNVIDDINVNNHLFQQQFETCIPKLSINYKLLNEELGIIQFIAERVHDTNPIYVNLKSRLFRIIESSKSNENTCIAAANAITILNTARVSMSYQNWDNIKIPYAVLNRSFLEGTIHFGEYAYFEGDSDCINFVQFSPDGSTIVSGSSDKIIQLWNVSSRKQTRLLKGHSDSVSCVQFSPDGSKIISSSLDKTIRLWDASSGKQIRVLEGHSDAINFIHYSFDGSKIVSGSQDKTIRLWDASSGKQLQILEGHLDHIYSVQFSSDGSTIVSGSNDKTIRLWSTSSGKQIQLLEGHSHGVLSVHFSPDGSKLVSGAFDKTIRIWEVSSGKQLLSFEIHTNRSDDMIIRLWDISSRKELHLWKGHTNTIAAVQFSPDGSKVVSSAFEKTIRLWDVSPQKQIQTLDGHSGHVYSVQFSFDGSKVISSSDDKTIQLRDASSGKRIQTLEGHSNVVMSAQFSPDGFRVVSGSSDNTIRLWDALSGKQLQLLGGHSDAVNSVHFSSDGLKIVSGSQDKTIRLWDAASGKQLQILKGHSSSIYSVQFSPDEFTIVSGSDDNTIRLWDVSTGKQLQIFKGHLGSICSVQFSPDGSKIVSGGHDKTIRLWNVSSRKKPRSLKGHSSTVSCVQFSPDGSKIVSGSWDMTIRLWDASSGKQLQVLKGHSCTVSFVRFSPDGSRIVSCSTDKTIRLWGMSPGGRCADNVIPEQIPSNDSKIVSNSGNKSSRLWNLFSRHNVEQSNSSKNVNANEKHWKCLWQGGVQSRGLSLEGSTWKGAKGLTSVQMLLVGQRGGIF